MAENYVGIVGKISPTGYDPDSFEDLIGAGLEITPEGKIEVNKAEFDKKVDKVPGMGLSANNLTDELVEKINNASTSIPKIPVATTDKAGIVKVGAGLVITPEGTLSVNVDLGNGDTGAPGTVAWQNVTNKPTFMDSDNASYLSYDALNNKPTAETYAGQGLEVSDGKVALSTEYMEYLEAQLYKKPTVSMSIAGWSTGTKEVGYSFTGQRTVTTTTTNVQNMQSTEYAITGTGASSSNPSLNGQTTITFNITTSAAGTYTVGISGRDKKNNTISASTSFSTVYPIYGGLGGADVSGSEITALAMKSLTSSANGLTTTVTPSDETKRYMWFCVPYGKTISEITGNGFGATFNYGAPIVVTVTNEYGKTNNYNCYRSVDPIKLGLQVKFVIVR